MHRIITVPLVEVILSETTLSVNNEVGEGKIHKDVLFNCSLMYLCVLTLNDLHASGFSR